MKQYIFQIRRENINWVYYSKVLTSFFLLRGPEAAIFEPESINQFKNVMLDSRHSRPLTLCLKKMTLYSESIKLFEFIAAITFYWLLRNVRRRSNAGLVRCWLGSYRLVFQSSPVVLHCRLLWDEVASSGQPPEALIWVCVKRTQVDTR